MAITVSKEFRTAFNFCMEKYGVIGEELEFEKKRVRENYEDAERCYLVAYAGLKKENK